MEITDERAKFETWDKAQFKHADFFYTKDLDGNTFTQYQIQGRWQTWQARAALEKDTNDARLMKHAGTDGELAEYLEKLRRDHWSHWTALENHNVATAVRVLRELDLWRSCKSGSAEKDAFPVVPEGLVLVPIEPTEEMLKRGVSELGGWCTPYDEARESGVIVESGMTQDEADYYNADSMQELRETYRAMLAAAPQPGNAQQEKAHD